MKTRILASVALLPLLLIVLIFLPPVFTAILLGAMCAIAAYELLWGTGLVKHPRLVCYTALVAAAVGIWCNFGSPYIWGYLVMVLFALVLFGEMLLSKAKLPFEKVLVCFAGGILKRKTESYLYRSSRHLPKTGD